jgi:hypothetical protein
VSSATPILPHRGVCGRWSVFVSIHVMSPVFRTRMKDPTQKLILLCLADFAHDDGTSAYPSMDTVSALCGCHLRTVRRWMKELQDDGYISLEKPPGYRRPASYRINMAKLKEGGQSVPHDEREGGHPCQRRGTPMSPNPL